MKKRNLIERRRALKEAYYNELRKAGIIDTPKVKTLEEMTKKELIELALGNGLELDEKLTKVAMIEMINNHVNSLETNNEEETVVLVEQEEVPTIENVEEALERIKDSSEETVNGGAE